MLQGVTQYIIISVIAISIAFMITKSLQIVEGSVLNLTTNQPSNLTNGNTTAQIKTQPQPNMTMSAATCDKSSIQPQDPIDMDSITWVTLPEPTEDLQPTALPVNMKTIYTEKETFDCRTSTGAHKVDVIMLTEVFGDSMNPGFRANETSFKVLECVRGLGGETLGCTEYSVPERGSDLNQCIEQEIAFPIERNSEILDITKRIVTAEKHVYNCSDRIKDVAVFTTLLGMDNNRTTGLAALATVCIKDTTKAKVESCTTTNLLEPRAISNGT